MAGTLQVSRERLIKALKLLGRMATQRKGQVILTFAERLLRIRSEDTEIGIPATGNWSGGVTVAGKSFFNLWREMPVEDPIPLRVEQDRLFLGSLSITCTWHEKVPELQGTGQHGKHSETAGASPGTNEPSVDGDTEQYWLKGLAPEEDWNEGFTRRALDELFSMTRRYRSSESYWQLLQFIARFHFYSPYNAMLVHIQMPGSTYVAPAHRWLRDFRRTIRPDARPLLILQPMGPVMFVFDVVDTVPAKDALPLPRGVEKPFEVVRGQVGYKLDMTIENAKRDGIQFLLRKEGSQSAGSIRIEKALGGSQRFPSHRHPDGTIDYVSVPITYNVLVNEELSREAQYTTFVHELAHLYCGHLGTPNKKWWPNRIGLSKQVVEFEAESVTYLVCERIGIISPSVEYLSGFVKQNGEVPPISMECIMKAAGLVEQMGKSWLRVRKD